MRGVILSTAEEVLARREQRRAEQSAALARWGRPLVSITMVAPGARKDSPALRRTHARALDAVRALASERGWPVLGSGGHGGATGPESWLAVDTDAAALKDALIAVEDGHDEGRAWDLDVIVDTDAGPAPLGRGTLGVAPRRCLLCADTAHACARARRHPLPVVVAAADAAASGHPTPGDAVAWAALAAEALRVEARLTPKPGLVDAAGSGAHHDMDLRLLVASADALEPWFAGCVLLGRAADDPDALAARLAELGVAAEAAMRATTGGVNTHKGALFSLGLLLAAIGRATVSGGRPSLPVILGEAAGLASWLNDAWRAGFREPRTHGERALVAAGVGGIRTEAASGFPTVRDVALPAYRARLTASGSQDAALRWALVALMSVVDDTNVVARGGVGALREVQAWAGSLLRSEVTDAEVTAALAAADARFTASRWSPGGSADLLALTWFLAESARHSHSKEVAGMNDMNISTGVDRVRRE